MSLNLFETRTTDPSREEAKKAKKEEKQRKRMEEKVRNEEKRAALQNLMDKNPSGY